MIRIAVLVSGRGSNLQAIIDAIAEGRLQAKIAVVVSNRPAAPALERAKKAGIPTMVVEARGGEARDTFDTRVVEAIREHRAEWVVLAGFMRIIGNVLLSAFPMRIINVHPSLLPAFPGLNAQAQALRHGVKVSGCTVHYVDGGTDTGPILAQAAVPVLEGDDEQSLSNRILVEEHRLLPAVLQKLSNER